MSNISWLGFGEGDLAMCGVCGATAGDRQRHEDWHRSLHEKVAQAWDEGYGDDLDVNTPRDNPYRARGRAAAGARIEVQIHAPQDAEAFARSTERMARDLYRNRGLF